MWDKPWGLGWCAVSHALLLPHGVAVGVFRGVLACDDAVSRKPAGDATARASFASQAPVSFVAPIRSVLEHGSRLASGPAEQPCTLDVSALAGGRARDAPLARGQAECC